VYSIGFSRQNGLHLFVWLSGLSSAVDFIFGISIYICISHAERAWNWTRLNF